MYYLKLLKHLPEYLGYFCKKICYQEVQKTPNLVTLIPMTFVLHSSLAIRDTSIESLLTAL